MGNTIAMPERDTISGTTGKLSTWIFDITFSSTQTIYAYSGRAVSLPNPISSGTAYHSGYPKNRAYTEIYVTPQKDGENLTDNPITVASVGGLLYTSSAWNSTETKSYNISSGPQLAVEDLFNSENPETRTVTVNYRAVIRGQSAYWASSTNRKYLTSGSLVISSMSSFPSVNVTLYAYPYWDVTDPGGTYAPGDAYTVNVTNLEAQYGGYITDCILGFTGVSGSVSSPSGGAMSINVPTSIGQYEPYIQVTDSRGQTSTQYLSKITVRNNSVNVSSASATRVNSSGIKDDSGTYAMVQATFNRLNATYLAPTVAYSTVGSSSRTSVSGTWYTSWSATGGFSNAVSNWSSLANGVTLYFKANGTYDKTITYMFYITPRGTATEGDTLTGATYGAYLSQEFFLISGRRGGKGLGIGRKADSNALQIGIPTQIISSLSVLNGAGQLTSLVDLIYPVGSYYETSDPNFNPATYWGGKWELEPAGRVNISGASSGTYTVPNTGGRPTASGSGSVPVPYHNHTGNSFSVSGQAASNGDHHHTVGRNVDKLQSGTNRDQLVGTSGGTTTSATSTTGAHTHDVTGTATGSTSYAGSTDAKVTISVSTIQPWRAVYRWHRIP